MNIYFAGSIAGGSEFKKQQQQIVAICEKLGHTVVSKQHAFQESSEIKTHPSSIDTPLPAAAGAPLKRGGRRSSLEKNQAQEIFERDLWWLMRDSDAVVAELSTPSYGLGFEMGIASLADLPILGLTSHQTKSLSAFVKGNTFKNFTWQEYTPETLEQVIEKWFNSTNKKSPDKDIINKVLKVIRS